MAWTSYEVEWWKEWVLSEALRLGVVPEAQNRGLEFKALFNICKGAKSDFRTCSEVLTASGNITLNLDCVLPQFHFVKRNTWELQKYLFTVCVLNSKYGILKCIKIVLPVFTIQQFWDCYLVQALISANWNHQFQSGYVRTCFTALNIHLLPFTCTVSAVTVACSYIGLFSFGVLRGKTLYFSSWFSCVLKIDFL